MTRTAWIVRWRGIEEERAGREDALDRWGQLDVRGIAADVLAVTPEGEERPVLVAARLDGVTEGARPTGFGAREAELTLRNQARSPSR